MEPPQHTRDRQNSRSLCFQHSKKLHRKGWLVLLRNRTCRTRPHDSSQIPTHLLGKSSFSILTQTTTFQNTQQHMEYKNILQTVIGRRTPPQHQHCSICQSSALLNTLLRKHFISSTLLLNKHRITFNEHIIFNSYCTMDSFHRSQIEHLTLFFHIFSSFKSDCTSCNWLISLSLSEVNLS